MANDEWYTPKLIFEDLDLTFDLDVASSDSDNVAVPAIRRYTIEHNGLDQEWRGLIWCNPPYSKPTPWVDKFIAHNNGILLVPFAKSKWFTRLWESSADLAILPPNLKFVRPDGEQHQIFMQCVLAGMGDIAKTALRRLETRIR